MELGRRRPTTRETIELGSTIRRREGSRRCSLEDQEWEWSSWRPSGRVEGKEIDFEEGFGIRTVLEFGSRSGPPPGMRDRWIEIEGGLR